VEQESAGKEEKDDDFIKIKGKVSIQGERVPLLVF
jgi:hypothetical protein